MTYRETITLPGGRPCLIRSCSGADAQEVYDCFQLTHAQTDYLLSYPEENSFDAAGEAQFLAQRESDPRSAELCAVLDGKIVGTAGIEPVGQKQKVRHRADFGISILQDFWGMGIGRALTAACIACARSAGCTQLELSAVRENSRALAMYEHMGFCEYGCNPRGFRTREGKWQELVLMRLELD